MHVGHIVLHASCLHDQLSIPYLEKKKHLMHHTWHLEHIFPGSNMVIKVRFDRIVLISCWQILSGIEYYRDLIREPLYLEGV